MQKYHDVFGKYLNSPTQEAKRSLLNRINRVSDFDEETLKKLSAFGCKILRLDAFAYLHKAIGQTNFFNKPGTWKYLDKIKQIAVSDQNKKYKIGLIGEKLSRRSGSSLVCLRLSFLESLPFVPLNVSIFNIFILRKSK
mgnify:CR=1 FL=1